MRLCFKTKVRFSDALLVSHRIIQRQRMQNISKFTFMLNRQQYKYAAASAKHTSLDDIDDILAACQPISIRPQVTQSQRVKTNIEENKTVKSYVTCSLSSLLGFWVVWSRSVFFFDFLPSKSGKRQQKTCPF